MSTPAIARLKVTLDGVEPAVMRRLEVPLDLRPDRLHLVLQAAIGWTNSHLWEIRARGIGWGPPQSAWGLDDDGPLNASKARLRELIEDTGARTFKHLYDFGDSWEHTVKIERVGVPEPDRSYPRLIDAHGRRQPEDVGGTWGHAEFLEAIGDPGHECHAELTEWHGTPFDPRSIERDALDKELAKLARRWSRKPAAGRSGGHAGLKVGADRIDEAALALHYLGSPLAPRRCWP